MAMTLSTHPGRQLGLRLDGHVLMKESGREFALKA